MNEFFTVLHVFLPESGGIRAIPGIPRNGILAVLPAKIVNSMHGILTDSGMATESPERNYIPESTGTESAEFV